MLPAAEQEQLREHLEWLYEPDSAYRVFIICLLIICGGELFQSPTTAMSDAATLQILGREQLDKYGAQRAWGPLGWAAGYGYCFFSLSADVYFCKEGCNFASVCLPVFQLAGLFKTILMNFHFGNDTQNNRFCFGSDGDPEREPGPGMFSSYMLELR